MKCSRCQHDTPAGTKFCGQCAAPLTHSYRTHDWLVLESGSVSRTG